MNNKKINSQIYNTISDRPTDFTVHPYLLDTTSVLLYNKVMLGRQFDRYLYTFIYRLTINK